MAGWSIDLGKTLCWNKNDGKFMDREVVIEYKPENSLPFSIKQGSGYDGEVSLQRKLNIEIINQSGLVRIGDRIFHLSNNQILQLSKIEGVWEYTSAEQEEFDICKWEPTEKHEDIGLVYIYNAEEEAFLPGHLQIYFKWETSNPVILYSITLGNSNMPKYENKSACEKFTLEYVDEINGLGHYVLCNKHVLLNEEQVNYLKTIKNRIEHPVWTTNGN